MEEIDEFLGINEGIENMQVDDQVNRQINNGPELIHGRNDQQIGIVNLGNNNNQQPAEVHAEGNNLPNNVIPAGQQMDNAGVDGLGQDIGQMNAGNQEAVGFGNQRNNRIAIDQHRGNPQRGNIEEQRLAGQQEARLPPANAGNNQLNNLPGRNHVQGDNYQRVNQGNRHVQNPNPNGQEQAGGVLQNVNPDQRANGRGPNRNRNARSAPYNTNPGRIRTRNYNNLSQLLMSLAKQGAYIPGNFEQDENDEVPQQ